MTKINNIDKDITISKQQIQTNQNQQTQKPISVFGDKNNNGIVDAEDFNKEDLKKLENNHSFSLFKELKWNENISKIIYSILNKEDNGEKTEETISDIQQGKFAEKHIQYDRKSKTLKIANKNGNDEFFDYKEYNYDENGRIKKSKEFDSTSVKYYKDGKAYSIGHPYTDTYIRGLGFGNRKGTPEKEATVNKTFADNEDFFFNKANYEYDENGNLKETSRSFSYSTEKDFEGKIKGRTEVVTKEDGSQTEIEYDRENNIITKNKVIYNTTQGSLKETYDKNDNLLYKTLAEFKELENETYLKTVTRQFANGNIYKEEDNEKKHTAELRDTHGKILEKYEIIYNNGQAYKVFSDGHKEKCESLTDLYL